MDSPGDRYGDIVVEANIDTSTSSKVPMLNDFVAELDKTGVLSSPFKSWLRSMAHAIEAEGYNRGLEAGKLAAQQLAERERGTRKPKIGDRVKINNGVRIYEGKEGMVVTPDEVDEWDISVSLDERGTGKSPLGFKFSEVTVI